MTTFMAAQICGTRRTRPTAASLHGLMYPTLHRPRESRNRTAPFQKSRLNQHEFAIRIVWSLKGTAETDMDFRSLLSKRRRFAVFGSCVSMQALRTLGVRHSDLRPDIMRGSFAGMIPAEPGCRPVDPARLKHKKMPAIIRTWLVTELSKQASLMLADQRPELLIVDLVDERFDLLVTKDGLVINESWDLVSSGWLELPELASARRVERLSEEAWNLWNEGLLRFRQWLDKQQEAPFRIALVCASWADSYVTPQGPVPFSQTITLMPGKEVSRQAYADLHMRYQSRFLELFPEAEAIQAPPETHLADPDHIWGLSPFHYVPAFYQHLAGQLKDMSTKDAEAR